MIKDGTCIDSKVHTENFEMKNKYGHCTLEERRDKYKILCKQEPTITVFNQAWWLDAVAPNNWDVVILETSGVIDAALPFCIRKTFGFTVIDQPPFTSNLGPWLRKKKLKYSKQLALEKDLLQEVYSKLPSYSFYSSSWHYSLTNWLPLYWLGFQQSTLYTYVLDDLSNLEMIYSNFEHSKRKNIKKSETLVNIKLHIPAREFYDNHVLTLTKEGKKISYGYELFERIYNAAYLQGFGFTIAAYGDDGELHGALFILKDYFSAYNLISTLDPNYRVLGSSSVLVREAIKESSKYVNRFDFEGSMIESVERSFRQFGAKQIPYFKISKCNSIVYSLAMRLRELFNIYGSK